MNLFGDDDIIYDDDERPEEDDDRQEDSYVPKSAEGLLPERKNTTCFGHDTQERLILELFEKNALPHAMIFSGIQGIGKTTMAFRLTRFLLKHGKKNESQNALFGDDIKDVHTSLSISEHDPVFARVASGGHPDLLHIARETNASTGKLDAVLKVETLRKINPFLRRTASEEGGWRVVLVEDADTMNTSSQNAILKILEEPPPKVMIILIAHRIGKLIPTIRSRSRVLPFSPLSTEAIDQLLSKQGLQISKRNLDLLRVLSDGSFGKALKYAEDGGLEILENILQHLQKWPNHDPVAINNFAASLSGASQDKSYRLFAELLPWVFRQLLFVKARGEKNLPECFGGHKALENMMQAFTLEQLVGLCDRLKTHFERVEFSHLDRGDAVRAGFLMISQ